MVTYFFNLPTRSVPSVAGEAHTRDPPVIENKETTRPNRLDAPSTGVCISAAVFFLVIFQNPDDRKDCLPIPCRRRRTEQLIDSAKIADRLHVATVHSEDESIFRRE